jgi:hypothetical protein
MRKRENGTHNIFGIEFRRVTSILGRLNRFGLEGWQASCAVDHVMSELVLPLIKGWMSIEQLQETDLERVRRAALDASAKKLNDAALTGRAIHRIINDYYRQGQNPRVIDQGRLLDPVYARALDAFRTWEQKYHVDMVASERQVFSLKHNYAGTLDLEAGIWIRGAVRHYVVDFKTGSRDSATIMQLAAYVEAVEEMDGKTLDGAGIVYLDKEMGTPKWVGFSREELRGPFELFTKLLSFIDLESRLEGDRTDDTPHTSPAAPTADSSAGPSQFQGGENGD